MNQTTKNIITSILLSQFSFADCGDYVDKAVCEAESDCHWSEKIQVCITKPNAEQEAAIEAEKPTTEEQEILEAEKNTAAMSNVAKALANNV